MVVIFSTPEINIRSNIRKGKTRISGIGIKTVINKYRSNNDNITPVNGIINKFVNKKTVGN